MCQTNNISALGYNKMAFLLFNYGKNMWMNDKEKEGSVFIWKQLMTRIVLKFSNKYK